MSDETSVTYPAGWYSLPDKSQERYWDGEAWTQAFRPILSGGGSIAPVHGPAIAAMVLGIISLVIWYGGIATGIIGLVFGATSLKHCQPKGAKRGRGMAIAGIVCSIIALVIWVLLLVIIVVISSEGGY
jgi:hypothetical protein